MGTVRVADAAAIEDAAAALLRGELVVLPTETVYGLGADAANGDAIERVYRLKGRPADHPLIVHVLDAAQAAWWATWSPRAQRLADAFWAGPLTLIVPRRDTAPAYACGAETTIGLRAPSHPVARALLTAFARIGGHGIAAPSANRFGRISPTRAAHVLDDLGDEAPIILDGGPCEVGLESTIVDLSRDRAVLLRPGSIGIARLESALGEPVFERDAQAPRASGTLDAHYAPITPVELVHSDGIDARIAYAHTRGERIALWVRAAVGADADERRVMPADATRAGQQLYDALRRLDATRCDRILVERVPDAPDWRAVADRLQRSAAASG